MPASPPLSKASDVFERIRRDIVMARLTPGSKLGFKMLSERYNVGFSPLREALFQLSSVGLVLLTAQRGFRVAPSSFEDLKDVVATRKHLELYAFNLSMLRGDVQWRRDVLVASDKLSPEGPRVGDSREIDEHWQHLHREFHFMLIGGCGSPSIISFCEQIYDRFDRYRRLALSERSYMASTASDHADIAASVNSEDYPGALLMLERHIGDVAEIVIDRFVALNSH